MCVGETKMMIFKGSFLVLGFERNVIPTWWTKWVFIDTSFDMVDSIRDPIDSI